MSQDEVSETPLAVGISPRRPAPELAGPLDLDQFLLEKARTIPDILSELYKSVMRQGTDYGEVPGTGKPSLWKAGAEILTRSLNLSPQNSIIDKIEQTEPERPYFDYTVECRLYGRNGFVGDGIGSCNTRETRYAFRWVYENQVPASLDKNKLATRSGFGKTQYRIPTPSDEIFGLKNTVLKMATKRAFVDAVLRVTGASRIFTQDIAEEADEATVHHAPKTETQFKTAADPTATSRSGSGLVEWHVPVTRGQKPADDVKEYPVSYYNRVVGTAYVDEAYGEVSLFSESAIKSDSGPVQSFLVSKFLEGVKASVNKDHTGEFDYELRTQGEFLTAVLVRLKLEPERLKEILNATGWTFSKATENEVKAVSEERR